MLLGHAVVTFHTSAHLSRNNRVMSTAAGWSKPWVAQNQRDNNGEAQGRVHCHSTGWAGCNKERIQQTFVRVCVGGGSGGMH